MPDALSPSERLMSRPLVLLAAGLGGMALAASLVMWARYGGAVFFEMIAAGLAACF